MTILENLTRFIIIIMLLCEYYSKIEMPSKTLGIVQIFGLSKHKLTNQKCLTKADNGHGYLHVHVTRHCGRIITTKEI